MKSIIFWDMTPCSLLSFNRCSSETSVETQWTTQSHIPEDDTLLLLCLFFVTDIFVEVLCTFLVFQLSVAGFAHFSCYSIVK
jgi:hypothetical protein